MKAWARMLWAKECMPMVCFILLSILFFVHSFCLSIQTQDFWFHAQVGQSIAWDHRIPHDIAYAYGAIKHRSFLVHSWLSSWWLFGGLSHLGYYGLSLVKWCLFLVLSCVVSACVYQQTQRRLYAVLAWPWVAVGFMTRPVLRPELIGVLCFMVLIWAMYAFIRRCQYRYVWLSLVVFCIWVNAHPSYWVGLYIPLVFMLHDLWGNRRSHMVHQLGSVWLPWGVIMAAFLAISCLNPYGLALHMHTLRSILFSSAIRAYAHEWQPFFHPMYISSPGWLMHLILFSTIGWFWYRLRAQIPLWGHLLMAPFACLALYSQRFVPFFMLASVLPIACALGVYTIQVRSRLCYQIGTGLLLFLLVYVGVQEMRLERPVGPWGLHYRGDFSQGALQFIQGSDLQGAVWNHPSFGGQLMYFFTPRLQISMDGRLDAYGDDYIAQIKGFFYQDWSKIRLHFQHHRIQAVMLEPTDIEHFKEMGIYQHFIEDHWCEVFSDQSAVILMQHGSCLKQ